MILRTAVLLGIIVTVIPWMFTGCKSQKDPAMGENDLITVIADSAVFEELRPALENAFEKIIFTPQEERWFRLVRVDGEALPRHKRGRNILFVAPLDGTGDVTGYLRMALDSSVQTRVRDGSEQVFVKKDVWFGGQTVVYLTGKTLPELENFIIGNAGRLQYYFKNAWDEREKNRMLSLSREEEIEERLMERHHWSLAAIKGWFVGKDSAEIQSVLLRRQSPVESERWLLVRWLDTTDTGLLNRVFLQRERNRLTEILFRTYDDQSWAVVDSIHHLQFDEVNFQGRYALRMQGLWTMNDHSMGGPFVSYLFYHEGQRRLYLLDGSVFAPRYEKKKLIQDVDVMMQTFRTAPENGPGKSGS